MVSLSTSTTHQILGKLKERGTNTILRRLNVNPFKLNWGPILMDSLKIYQKKLNSRKRNQRKGILSINTRVTKRKVKKVIRPTSISVIHIIEIKNNRIMIRKFWKMNQKKHYQKKNIKATNLKMSHPSRKKNI